MATNISSSLIANSTINQKQSQFKFPLNFPFRFTIESVNTTYAEIGALGSSITINGTLKAITPITCNVASSTSSNGQLNNNLNLTTNGLNSTTTVNSTIINTLKLISNLGSTSSYNISLTSKSNIISTLNSSVVVSATDYLQLNLNGNTLSVITINSQSTSTMALSCSLTSNSAISSTITSRQVLAPQVINATSTINDIETAIFKLVTNIVANTAIAISSIESESLISNLNSNTTISGNLVNLIGSNLNQYSNINLPQTWRFPLQFPLLINDGQLINYNIKGNLNSASIITDNSVQDLLSVNLGSQSNINATISCTYSEKSSVCTNSNIASSIISQMQTTSNMSSNIATNATIAAQLKEVSNITSNTTTQGTMWNLQNCISGVVSNSSVVANIANSSLIVTNEITSTTIAAAISAKSNLLVPNINAVSSINSAITSASNLIGSINANDTISSLSAIVFNELSDLDSETVIHGASINLIDSSLSTQTNIEIQGINQFPLTFPLYFNNGICNNLNLNPQILTGNSQINNNAIQNLLMGNVQSNTGINVTLTCKYSSSSNLSTNTNIVASVKQNLELTSSTINLSFTINNANLDIEINLLGNIEANNLTDCLIKNSALVQSSLDVTSDIEGTVYDLIESSLIANSTIEQTQKFNFPLKLPLVFLEDIIGGLIQLESDLKVATDIEGNISIPIESELFSESSIELKKIFEFPLNFPLCFDEIFNNVIIDSDIDSNSITTGHLSSLLFATETENTNISGTLKNVISLSSSFTANLIINDVTTDISQISGNVVASSNITGAITVNNKLAGNIISNSSLNGTVKNNIGLLEQLISNSNINARVSYLYFIVLQGTFIKNINANYEFNQNNYTNFTYKNYFESVILNKDIANYVYMGAIKEIEIFNVTNNSNVQVLSIDEKVIKISNIYETVIFNQNISLSGQIKTYKLSSQFTNILYNTKF
ncbi:hypothetical protein [Clostridium sp.]|uniref:beta strand repeat-containing protein n=1 Tax=Clostridium sp. TaxID=1506 RepID=UPI00284058B4|nr:hypothetical protein [Clostridium sp.]MDR3595089.1 hypothetical protein [Clostridium sp.]